MALLNKNRLLKLVFDEEFSSVRVIFDRKSSFGFAQDDRTRKFEIKND